MERIVVDASVVVKWFVPEKDTGKALKLRDLYVRGDVELLSPTLLYYEVSNALRYHPYYRLTETQLLRIVKTLKDMQITVEPTAETWLNAFKLSLSEEIDVYDAVYMAMALSFDGKLITSDRRLVEKLGGKLRRRVQLLETLNI